MHANKEFVDADLSERGIWVIGIVVGQVGYPRELRQFAGPVAYRYEIAGLKRRWDILQTLSQRRPFAHPHVQTAGNWLGRATGRPTRRRIAGTPDLRNTASAPARRSSRPIDVDDEQRRPLAEASSGPEPACGKYGLVTLGEEFVPDPLAHRHRSLPWCTGRFPTRQNASDRVGRGVSGSTVPQRLPSRKEMPRLPLECAGRADNLFSPCG
jgi:hypothetical protein